MYETDCRLLYGLHVQQHILHDFAVDVVIKRSARHVQFSILDLYARGAFRPLSGFDVVSSLRYIGPYAALYVLHQHDLK